MWISNMTSVLKTKLGQIECVTHGKYDGCDAICILHGAGGSYKNIISRSGYSSSFVKDVEQPNFTN